ncbi:hypothetical protein [Rhodopseudomonas pseudopalustris]|uniref:hypothetical protein n=1 Tax=Rhodopseudomonas pseudopalustris TaxID=1513892 RepID=UPI001113D907|nr:hypothetical protein [Rhodopseudomonas pseudopalustris]
MSIVIAPEGCQISLTTLLQGTSAAACVVVRATESLIDIGYQIALTAMGTRRGSKQDDTIIPALIAQAPYLRGVGASSAEGWTL